VRILLVIPCLRERARLPVFLPALLPALRGTAGEVDVLVVDDGSGGEEQAWLAGYIGELQPAWPNLLPPLLLAANAGKGGAVYAGWETAGGYTHVGFVDADGAIPPAETARLCALATHTPTRAIYAVRTGTDDTTVRRDPGRALAGNVFRMLVRFLFRFPLPETQCGCKIVPAEAWRACAGRLSERRFCFDVDLTWHLLQHGTEIRAVPIDWTEVGGGQLRAGSVAALILSLVGLRFRLGSWRGVRVGSRASFR
jgi:dolichyl-phosphate beta-glucosyltransferase